MDGNNNQGWLFSTVGFACFALEDLSAERNMSLALCQASSEFFGPSPITRVLPITLLFLPSLEEYWYEVGLWLGKMVLSSPFEEDAEERSKLFLLV